MSDKNIKPLSNTETAAFCSQMAMILKSGDFFRRRYFHSPEDVDDPDEKESSHGIERYIDSRQVTFLSH